MTAPRIRVLRGGAIGDFVVTLPAIRLLRERWPDAYIDLVGYPHITSLAVAGGLVDRVTSLDGADIARLFSLRPDLPDGQRQSEEELAPARFSFPRRGSRKGNRDGRRIRRG